MICWSFTSTQALDIYKQVECRLKCPLLHFHLDLFPENLEAVNNYHCKRFHHDPFNDELLLMEACYRVLKWQTKEEHCCHIVRIPKKVNIENILWTDLDFLLASCPYILPYKIILIFKAYAFSVSFNSVNVRKYCFALCLVPRKCDVTE